MLISDDVSLTWENSRGGKIVLAPHTDYFLASCDDSLENTINSDKQGNLDGEVFMSASLGIRHFVIKGFFGTASGGADMKRQIERVFNMTLPGTLTYHNSRNQVTRRIDCRVESLPEVALGDKQIDFEIELAALQPLWTGGGMSGSISTINKMGRFPIVIPPEKFVFGYRLNVFENIIDNIGDVACGATFRLRASTGTVTNPSITHVDSGSVIKIIRKLETGEYFDVITAPGRAQVILNGVTDATQYLTDVMRRRFFTLYVGRNKIGYEADENVANLDVSYKSEDLYLGV